MIHPDTLPMLISPVERQSAREYLQASPHHALGNSDALKALNSIESAQEVLSAVFEHLTSCDDESEIDVDRILNWITGVL